MSVKKRKEKEKQAREATLGGSLFMAIISALIGLLAGIWTLAGTPAIEVRDMPPEDKQEPGAVYLLRGADQASVGYRPKLDLMLSGRPDTYSFSEKELNTWARDTFRFATAGSDNEGLIRIVPAAPNFRLTENGMQIAVNTEVAAWGNSRKLWYQVRGVFDNGQGVPGYKVDETFIGSAKIPPVGMAALLNMQVLRMFKGMPEAEKLLNLWSRLASVRVENGALVFELR